MSWHGGREISVEVQLGLPKDVAAELDQLAEATGRSKSYHVRRAIMEFLENRADYLGAVTVLERERGPTSPSKTC